MTVSILRTAEGWWVQTPSGGARIRTDAATTAEVLAARHAIDDAAHSTDMVPVQNLSLLSPVTTPCRLVAQATNYVSHVRDVGCDPAKTPLTFFRKASGSVAGPFDDIVKPPHVRLLDYELEIGLLIGRALPVGTEVTEANLGEFVHGLLVTNDVSARDVQLTKAQFYESKSIQPSPGRAGAGPGERRELSASVICLQLRVTVRCVRIWWLRAICSTRWFRLADAGEVRSSTLATLFSRYAGWHCAHCAWVWRTHTDGSDDIFCCTGNELNYSSRRRCGGYGGY